MAYVVHLKHLPSLRHRGRPARRFQFDFSGDRRLDPTRDTRKLRELRSKVRVQEAQVQRRLEQTAKATESARAHSYAVTMRG